MKNPPATHRALLATARWYYQRHALACEHVDEEIRLILAGQRGSLRRLRDLQATEEQAWKNLQPHLQDIAGRIRKADTGDELWQYLDTAAQNIARAGKKSA